MSQENIVRHMLKLSAGRPRAAVESRQIAEVLRFGRLQFLRAASALKRRGWVERSPQSRSALRLTALGLAQAERLDRAHRLWETFLVEKVGLASDHVHPTAEKVEHLLSDQLVESVDDVLGHPIVDPHGAPIPRSPIADRVSGAYTLSKLRAGDRARVVALVEPRVEAATTPSNADPSAAAVAELGLTLGQTIEVVKHDVEGPSWTVVLGDGRLRDVSHRLADLVLVHLEQPAE